MSASDKHCPNCGASNSFEAATCFACGRSLSEPGSTDGPAPTSPALPPFGFPIAEKRRRPLVGWLIAGLAGVALLLIFGVIFHPFSSQGVAPVKSSLASADRQVLVLGVNDGGVDPVLDPMQGAGADDLQIESLLYSGLTTVDGRNQLVPDLAQSWSAQQDPDGTDLNWTFHLRPNLKFSDGSPLTSVDVAYSIDRVFSSPDSLFAYLAPYFKDGAGRLKGTPSTLIGDSLLTPDPNTLIIKAQGQGVFLPAITSTYCFKVVSRVLIDKYGKDFTKHLDEGGTSGPFKQDSRKDAGSLNLQPNAFYYNNSGHLKKVTVLLYSDANKEHADYKAGRISIMESPDYDTLTASEQSARQVELVSGISYLGMNYLTRPFDNTKIRQAFALGLDKVAVMDGAYKAGYLATNHIIPDGQPGYNQTLTGPAGVGAPQGDLGEARLLLQQGMQEEGIKSIQQFPAVTFTYNSGNIVSVQDQMNLIQRAWKNTLGLDIKPVDIGGKELADKIRGSANNPDGLQLWATGWIVDYPDPQNWTSLQFSKGSIWNVSNYGQNKSADAAAQQQVQADLLKADTIQDAQKRLKAYQKAEQQLVNDVAWLPLSQNNHAVLIQPNVQGYHINGSGIAAPDVVQAMYIHA
ncbi:MAG: peptide ABC transporter substrate-binding protein [Ktedonobacteraceae bacterium]